LILIIFIIGIATGITFTEVFNSKKIDALKKQVDKNNCLEDKVDVECLKLTIEKHKIKFSHIVLAQAILESNNFKSDLYKRNWNCFGMFVAGQRLNFAENNYDFSNYAKYSNLENCVLDYVSWQKSNAYNISTEEQYFELLKKIYAKDENYIFALKKIIAQNRKK